MRAMVVGLAMMAAMAGAEAQPAPVEHLFDIEKDLDTLCRGSAEGGVLRDDICEVRDKAVKALYSLGYCYGKEGQAGYQMKWHRCGRGSQRHSNG